MKRSALNVRNLGKLTVTAFAALLMGTAIGCADGNAGDRKPTKTGAVDSATGDDADGSSDKNSEEESGSSTR